MLLLRRIMAITLLASFAGSQPASSGCVMMSDVETSSAAAETVATHAHHDVDSPASFESAPVHGQSHSGPATNCGPAMACAAAAPAGTVLTVPTPPFTVEVSAVVPGAAHAAPSLAFEPPPPRQILI
jgi:hypothetical protein